jgi:hypothetical protein
MFSVASLLNPITEDDQNLPTPAESSRFTSECSSLASPPPPAKRQKLAKDAAIFLKGKVREPIRYPPWESFDAKTVSEMKKFSIYPLCRIANFHRRIPYNSEKKRLFQKTGREAFEGSNSFLNDKLLIDI